MDNSLVQTEQVFAKQNKFFTPNYVKDQVIRVQSYPLALGGRQFKQNQSNVTKITGGQQKAKQFAALNELINRNSSQIRVNNKVTTPSITQNNYQQLNRGKSAESMKQKTQGQNQIMGLRSPQQILVQNKGIKTALPDIHLNALTKNKSQSNFSNTNLQKVQTQQEVSLNSSDIIGNVQSPNGSKFAKLRKNSKIVKQYELHEEMDDDQSDDLDFDEDEGGIKSPMKNKIQQPNQQNCVKPPNTIKQIEHIEQEYVQSKNDDKYDIEDIVDKMLQRRDRRIPGSVYKPHNDQVMMIESNVSSKTVFFPYPKYCFKNEILEVKGNSETFMKVKEWQKEQRVKIANQDYFKENNQTLGFKVTETTHIYNSVVNTFKSAGVRIVAPLSSKWNVMWTGVTRNEYLQNVTKYQRINHFPQSFQIGRKDLMYKNIIRIKRSFPELYNFCPKTYILPEDYRQFQTDREVDNFKHMYIVKPAALSCGKGIKVISQRQVVKNRPQYVISQYLSKPYLINGFKFDLRIYCLVTCFDPVKIYMFKEGLVRFATQKYTTDAKSVDKQFIHLTNYSVNKKNEEYVKSNNQEESSKWNLAQLKRYFDKAGVDYQLVMHRIKDVMIKTVISVEPHIVQAMQRQTRHKNVCFELFGFDILLDHKLKPWLLEVNISPSLSSSSPLDKKIKTVLICDTLNLVGVQPYDRKLYERDQEKADKNRLLGTSKVEEPIKINHQFSKIIKAIGDVSEDETQMIIDFEEEQQRLGNFEKIYPCINNVKNYSIFFENQRATNMVIQKYLLLITPKQNDHHICYLPPTDENVNKKKV